MRLALDKIKNGILHPEMDARKMAVSYFTDSYSRDPEILPLAIQAIEKYSRAEAFEHVYWLSELVQTEATVEWMMSECRRSDIDRFYAMHLGRSLIQADPRLLRPFAAELLQMYALGLSEEYALRENLEFATWNAEQCWAELERIVALGKGEDGAENIPFDRAERLVQAMSRLPDPGIDRVLTGLAVHHPEESEQVWMECSLVQLAGELRLGEAVELLVRKWHEQYFEPLFQDVYKALKQIGTEEVVTAIGSGFAEAGVEYRMWGADCLESIRGDACVRLALELLETQKESTIRTMLASSLLKNFSEEGLEKVRQQILAGEHDDGRAVLESCMVASAKVMGITFPEFARWDANAKASRRETQRRVAAREKPFSKAQSGTIASIPSPPASKAPPEPKALPVPPQTVPPPTINAGRNDKCPCGSGKKFKVCCMNKSG